MKITTIIPVREGSRRLKNQNVAPFAGTNLLVNKVNQLKQVEEISNIVVSSDSGLMLAMAESRGVDMDESVSQIAPYIVGVGTSNRFKWMLSYGVATEKEVAA